MDYPLYGLAIVLFALTAITLVMVEDEGKLVYAASTAVLGVVSLVAGYFLRPKNIEASLPENTTPEQTTQQAAVNEPNLRKEGSIVAAPTTQIQVSEAPRIETLAVQAPILSVPQAEAPVTLRQREAHATEVATSTQAEVSDLKKAAFSQIRSINRKREEQLNSLGIMNMKDLANASPTDLAEKLNVSIKIVKMWIGSAKKLSK